jgi:glutaminase
VGIPAKSGVGGCIFMVVPNLGGISIWSPRLDKLGNPVRGIAVAKSLVEMIELHNFEVFSGLSGRRLDIKAKRHFVQMQAIAELIDAASQNDLNAVQAMINGGADIFACDYDQRTAMHLAASGGNSELLKLLIGSLSTQ